VSSAAPVGLVSVIIPAFNAERHVGQAVDSVLRQTHQDLEVVVVDDGSTDGTVAVVQRFPDRRVRLVCQANGGVASARNRGIRETCGEWVALLDADDYWLPQKIQVQLAEVARRPDLLAVGSFMSYLGEADRPLGVAGMTVGPREQKLVAEGRLTPFPPGSTALIRREPLEALGGFDESLRHNAPAVEDLDLISRLATQGEVGCVPEVLAVYRLHSGSSTLQHFFDQQRGTRFITARRAAEARGQSLSWDDFAASSPPTLWERRRDLAAYSFRRAALSAARNEWLLSAVHGGTAAVLAPWFTVRKLARHRPWLRLPPEAPVP